MNPDWDKIKEAIINQDNDKIANIKANLSVWMDDKMRKFQEEGLSPFEIIFNTSSALEWRIRQHKTDVVNLFQQDLISDLCKKYHCAVYYSVDQIKPEDKIATIWTHKKKLYINTYDVLEVNPPTYIVRHLHHKDLKGQERNIEIKKKDFLMGLTNNARTAPIIPKAHCFFFFNNNI